jgi:hypothetical protein
MSSSESPTRSHVSRELLERVRRDLLVRLVAPYRLVLEAKGVPLDALAATAQDDLALVDALFAFLASDDPAVPAALVDALGAIAAVACEAGHERLRMLDRDKRLPQGRLGHETLATIAFLDHAALFTEVKVTAKTPAPTARVEYPAKSNKPLPRDPARFAALGKAMAALFASRGRPAYCDPRVTWGEHETVIDFVFGRLPTTNERLTEELTRTQAVDVLTQRARAVITRATGHLGVTGFEFMREGIRRLLGEHVLGDADHFQRVDLYSLLPLEESLVDALAPHPELGVDAIELREIYIRRADGALSIYAHAVNVLASSVEHEVRAALAAGGKVEHAKLAFGLAARKRKVRVEITPPRRLDLARGDGVVESAVRGLLEERAFLRLPEAVWGPSSAAGAT